jgi:hypothetical protein
MEGERAISIQEATHEHHYRDSSHARIQLLRCDNMYGEWHLEYELDGEAATRRLIAFLEGEALRRLLVRPPAEASEEER